jgi:hypothetical protein
MAKKKTKSKHSATKKVVKKTRKHITKPIKTHKKNDINKPKTNVDAEIVVQQKKSKIKILEAETKIREISEFEMNEIVSRLIHKAKTRKRNRNTIE